MRSTGTLDSLGTLSGSIWQSDLLGVCVACESKVLNFRAMTLRKSLRFPAVTCTLLVSLEEYRIISFLCDAVQLVPAVTCLVAVSLEDYKTIGFLGRSAQQSLVRCLFRLKSTVSLTFSGR